MQVAQGRVRVLVVDDHPMVRDWLTQRLGREPNLEVVGQAAEGEQALVLAREQRADLVVLDLGLPGLHDGMAVLGELGSWAQSPKVVILTGQVNSMQAIRCYRAGACAFLGKTSEPEELLDAIHTVLAGRRYVPSELAGDVANYFIEHGHDAGDPLTLLSERELQVLHCLAAGETNREIATRFSLSVRTVDSHRANLLRKLNLRNNSDLTRAAINWRMV